MKKIIKYMLYEKLSELYTTILEKPDNVYINHGILIEFNY